MVVAERVEDGQGRLRWFSGFSDPARSLEGVSQVQAHHGHRSVKARHGHDVESLAQRCDRGLDITHGDLERPTDVQRGQHRRLVTLLPRATLNLVEQPASLARDVAGHADCGRNTDCRNHGH